LQIGFVEKVIPSAINIYETFNAGGVRRVLAKNLQDAWVELYKATRIEKIPASRIFSPVLKVGFHQDQSWYICLIVIFRKE
jgi:hypothetical protein